MRFFEGLAPGADFDWDWSYVRHRWEGELDSEGGVGWEGELDSEGG